MKSECNGQLSIFDISIEKNTNVLKKNSKAIFRDCNKPTLDQLNLKSIYKMFLERYPVDRVIHYVCGSLGIEVREKEFIKTHYINKHGKEEFTFNRRSPVLPSDQIIYYTKSNYKLSDIQLQRLNEILEKENIRKIIRRKGDLNIILIRKSGDVLSIIPNGWILEFNNTFIKFNTEDIISVNEIFKL